MRGTHQITVRNNKLQIKLTVKRNITILQGQSATGKTTLIDLIRDYDELGLDSGTQVNCDVPCKVVAGRNWQRDLSDIENSIVFIDEDNAFIRSEEFARAAKSSTNYYVLVSRSPLTQLPYSVEEIYGLRNTGKATSKYPSYRRTYTSTYQVYADDLYDGILPELVIVEDSNSGFEFFSALCAKSGIPCISAQSKSKIYSNTLNAEANSILIVADGAAFGPEMQLVLSLRHMKKIKLFLPESFEWLILSSKLFNDAQTQEILSNPSDFIESSEFFSWERFFTKELIEKTAGTYLAYQKSKLNPAYLQPKAFNAISECLPDLEL